MNFFCFGNKGCPFFFTHTWYNSNKYLGMRLEFLIKYMEGTSDQQVVNQVDQWLSEDPGNNRYLEKVKKVWFAVDELKALSDIDVNRDWEAVELRLTTKSLRDGNTQKIRIRLNSLLFKIAAVLVIGIMISSLFFYLNRESFSAGTFAGNHYEVIVPDGQKSNLVLPDGTKVMVNAGSKLFLPKEVKPGKREVWLDGEAFFQVTRNPRKPFFVHTSDINVKVLGTTFNVRAYHDEKIVETTLLEGKVMLNTTKETGTDQDVALAPNHKAVFITSKDAEITATTKREFGDNLKVGKILISDRISPETAVSWTQGKLIFENEYFDVIAHRLEKYYGIHIHITDEFLKNIKYTGTIKNISLEQTLRALQLTTHFSYTIKDEDVTLSK